jgi:nitrite reductase/ring-hydroxylating ferredoxin subunit
LTRHVVAQLSELALETPRLVEVGGNPVCVVRTVDGVHAVSDTCSHAEVSLSEGEVEGTTIECWLHGSRFDLLSGRPTGLPATEPVPVFEVIIDGDDVLIDDSPTHSASANSAPSGSELSSSAHSDTPSTNAWSI